MGVIYVNIYFQWIVIGIARTNALSLFRNHLSLELCKKQGVDTLLNRIHTHPKSRIKELMPQHYWAAVQS